MFDHAKFCAAPTHARAILDVWQKYAPTADLRWTAYSFATALRETGYKLQPVAEIGQGRGHGYGVPTGPWHLVYYDRGDVELARIGNYRRATTELRKAGVIGNDVDLGRCFMRLGPFTDAVAIHQFQYSRGTSCLFGR